MMSSSDPSASTAVVPPSASLSPEGKKHSARISLHQTAWPCLWCKPPSEQKNRITSVGEGNTVRCAVNSVPWFGFDPCDRTETRSTVG